MFKTYDLFDHKKKQRIEVKFSVVSKKNENTIQESNVLKECIEAAEFSSRIITYQDASNDKYVFDCNIQQVKPSEFEVLYYGLFFYDCIRIYKLTKDQFENEDIPSSSDKQHLNSVGEGQFHIKNSNLEWHQKFFVKQMSYKELYNLLK